METQRGFVWRNKDPGKTTRAKMASGKRVLGAGKARASQVVVNAQALMFDVAEACVLWCTDVRGMGSHAHNAPVVASDPELVVIMSQL